MSRLIQGMLGSLLMLFLVVSPSMAADRVPELPSAPPAKSGGFEGYRQARQGPGLPSNPPGDAEKAPIFGGANFDAYDFDDNATENGGFVFIPPDPMGAAGRDRLISVVNTGIECRDKTGTLLFRDALRDFFAPAVGTLGTFTFDPKIVYDQYADRFVVIALEQWDAGSGDPSDESRILLAVSRTALPATPTAADWYYTVINAKTVIGAGTTWADYPGLEVDEEAVYVTNNMFPFTTSAGSFGVRLWIVDKGLAGGFYAGGAAAVTVHDPYAALPGFETTTMPAHVFGAAGVAPNVGTYLLSYSGLTFGGVGGLEAINVIRVNNPLGAVSFTQEFVTISDIEDIGGVFGFPALADAPQLGGPALIEVNDRRLLDAVWRNGYLWMCTTITPNVAFDPLNAGQTTAHWIQLDATAVASNASPAGLIFLRQEGDAGGEDIDPDMYTFFPAIAVNSLDQMKLGFSGSSPTSYGSAYVAGRIPADPAGTVGPTGVVRAGVDYYLRTFGSPRNRWGDYSGIAVDPTDGTTFWLYNEWADVRGTPIGAEDGRWGTAWLECSFSPIASADLIVTILDAPCCTYHGDKIGPNVLCEVRNIGAGNAGPFTVGLYVSADNNITVGDDPLVNGQVPVAGLVSGGIMIVPFPGAEISAAAPLGEVFLGAYVDDTFTVAETDESNNTSAYAVAVNTAVEGCTRAMASTRAAPTQVSVFNVPDGSGNPLSAAQTLVGVTVDATIDFMAQDCDGNPVVGIRPFLATTLGGLVVCPGDSKSDAPTNAAGVATFSGRLYAGGYTDPANGELTRVFGMGAPFAEILYGNKDMFASDQQGNIARVNLATGAAGIVCNLGPGYSTEIEYNPLTGRSFATGVGGVFVAREFDMFSCAALAPDVPTISVHNGMEWIGPDLFSANILNSCGNSTFSRLDPTTGIQADIGPTGWGPITGLAWDACCRVLYGTTGCTNNFGPSNLLRIDPATGAATLIGNTQIQIGSIEFGPDHRLYAGGGQADGGNLWILDTNTAAAFFVGPTGLIGVTGLALVSDPGLDIQFNSADIDGDLVVNLADLGLFAADFNGGAYMYRSDFKWDLALNLADVGLFAGALGAVCPAVIPAKPSNVATAGDIGVYFDAAATQRTLDAEPGSPITAYVLARGDAATSGVSAWEYRVETSGNVVVDEWILDEKAINVGEGNDVIVGLGRTKDAAEGTPLMLGQVRFHVTDREPARIDLTASSKPSVDGDRPVVLIGESLATLEVASLANGASAALNDDSVETMDSPAFAGVQLRNTPNPFNPATEIQFSLPRAGFAEVRIYDVSGREVRRLGGDRLDAGSNAYRWNGTDNHRTPVVSGVYFYRLFLDGDAMGSPVKMTLLK